MLIAVNTRLLLKDKLEGIGRFSHETLKRICTAHPEHEYVFLFDRRFDAQFVYSGNITPVVISPPSRHPLLWYWWFEYSLPRFLKKIKPDLFLSPDGYLSLRAQVKSLAVIHDINFEHYPESLPPLYSWYYRHYFPKYARKAARIATVSEFSKNDIAKTYSIAPDKIDVVYNGVNEGFKPHDETTRQATKKKYSSGTPYFLCTGAIHERKNIVNLLKAFDEFRKNYSTDIKLILAGNKKWWSSSMEESYTTLQHKQDVIFTGRVSDEELFKLTGAALAAVYVSKFEGFGIPVLEAMKCSVPVIASAVTSLPEICGDAALLADPDSISAIADAMKIISADEQTRKVLTGKGRERAENFSWNKTAGLLWQSIEKTLTKT